MRKFLLAADPGGCGLLRRPWRRTRRTRSSARFTSRQPATKSRSGGSTARCAISIRSGTPNPRRSTKRPSRPTADAPSPIGASRCRCLNNPHSAIPAPNLPLGLAAIEKAKEAGAKSERERDYIDALSVMYVDYDKIPQQARVQSYLKKMEALAAKYPDDDEAQIFYAITLNVAASPADKTYANQLKGAAILEPIWQRQPQHPGVAHYLIHLYDYPPIAAKGLPAALRYSKIAPNAPHAQHMPSHIFTRVGYWKESITANLASVEAAKAQSRTRRATSRRGLYGLRLSAARPGRQCAQGDRNHRSRDARSGFLRRRIFARRRACALRVRTRRLEGRSHARRHPEQVSAGDGDFSFCPRDRRRALGRRRPPRAPMPPSLSNFATVCARPRATTGPRKSMSRCRPRMPGSSTPTANTMTR